MSKKQQAKPTPRRVLALWRNHPDWKASAKEVRDALGATRANAPKVRAILDGLVRDGILSHNNRHYTLSNPGMLRSDGGGKTQEKRPPEGIVGRFNATQHGYAFISTEEHKEDLFVPAKYIGGALDGDLVEVALHHGRRDPRPYAKVVAVVARQRETVRGTIHRDGVDEWLVPFNHRLPLFLLDGEVTLPDEAPAEARITAYPDDADEAPVAELMQGLPEDEEIATLIDHLVSDAQLPVEFSSETQKEMASLDADLELPPAKPRKDLRERLFVTIDGEDARDFDDAVSVDVLARGGYRLYVAIADVAHYVEPGLAVDDDAYDRGTSTYFPGRVIPMLPERLSNDLCSLRPDEPRLTLTCEMELDARGQPVKYQIYESVIQSRARLTYTQVAAWLEDHDAEALPSDEVRELISHMGQLAQVLEARRNHRGALHLVLPEARIQLDESGLPVGIGRGYPNRATKLIEQFMLEANETVARHCHERGLPVLYRVHDPPPPEQIQELRELLVVYGFELSAHALATPGGMNEMLDRVEQHPMRDAIELAMLRTMSQACYRGRNDGHFGLAADHYCHFTSPIRRYPDLLVHRALKADVRARGRKKATGPAPLPQHAGLHLSTRERAAEACENQVKKLYTVVYMESHLGESFPASVAGVSERGLWLTLRDDFVDGLLPIDGLDARYRYDRQRNVLTGRGGRNEIGFGTRVTAQLTRADRTNRQLEFALGHWGWEDAEAHDEAQAQRQDRTEARERLEATRADAAGEPAEVASAGQAPARGKAADQEGAKSSRSATKSKAAAGGKAGAASKATASKSGTAKGTASRSKATTSRAKSTSSRAGTSPGKGSAAKGSASTKPKGAPKGKAAPAKSKAAPAKGKGSSRSGGSRRQAGS